MSYTLMLQGTASDVGKTTLVAGLGRLLSRRGVRVAPFKPQNMALNSAVTADGGEIGRAQALQAAACGIAPETAMNPVLLKPQSDTGAEVIVNGRAIGTLDARAYHAFKPRALAMVLDAWRELRTRYDVILVEGAGSPAEVNLRSGDIANMGFAEVADCPVVLVADIDKGGVFAQAVGTLACLSASEQARIKGFIINKFRGDRALLRDGEDWLENRTGKAVLGVVPFWHGLDLDGEDALVLTQQLGAGPALRVRVPALPRISNHTDFDVLRRHPQVDFAFVPPNAAPPSADLIILPGTKNVIADLHWLIAQGWEPALRRHLRYGGRLLGICGGLQMLGTTIADPLGLEGAASSASGFGLCDFRTTLRAEKTLRHTRGRLCGLGAEAGFAGYEIHRGESHGAALARPLLKRDDGSTDGAISADGQIMATYVHGLFDHPDALAAILAWAGVSTPQPLDRAALREAAFDQIADDLEAALDLERLFPGLL